MLKLSIVTTLYRSENFIEEFLERITPEAEKIAGDHYEIVIVNDGSPDSSIDICKKIAQKNKNIKIVDLSRNFGHHKAMMTGLMNTKGDFVYLTDCDLEEPPEWLEDFYQQLKTDKVDVVFGVQEKRKGQFVERFSGYIFWSLLRFFTQLDLPDNIIVARIMSRKYVDALITHKEREVFLAGLWAITGFKQSSRTVQKGSRPETTYTFRKKLSQLINSITSFSNLPLIGIFFIGCIISFFAGVYSLFLVINWLSGTEPPSGYTSLMASVWLIGGILTASIGTVGLYIAKIFTEVKQRPYTIVKHIYSKENLDKDA